MDPFATSFELPLSHGLCVGVIIPARAEELWPPVPAVLDPAEIAWARELPAGRRPAWIAGRVALRRSLEKQGLAAAPLLAGTRGEPRLPTGVAGSISHKDGLAVALAGPSIAGELGIDLERAEPVDLRIARRVLTAEERLELGDLPPSRAEHELRLRFTVKEAVYKALHPWVRRRVDFHEVRVRPDATGAAEVLLDGAEDLRPLAIEAEWQRRDGWIIATARSRRSGSPAQPV